MANFKEKVMRHFNELSPRQQKVAKFLLENPEHLAIKSASSVGKEAGVSETTVIRFCYSLHYDGYAQLQQEIQEELLYGRSSLNQYSQNKRDLISHPHFYKQVMQQDISSIEKTIQQIREEDVQMAVDRLSRAEHILIFGCRTSYASAHWLAFTLNLIRGNTRLFRPDTDDILLELAQLNEKAVCIAISFHRYVKETIKLAKAAKGQQSYVIGITDSQIAPLAEHVNLLMPVCQSVRSTIDAAPAVFSLMNALVAGVCVSDQERFKARQMAYESMELDHFYV